MRIELIQSKGKVGLSGNSWRLKYELIAGRYFSDTTKTKNISFEGKKNGEVRLQDPRNGKLIGHQQAQSDEKC